MADYDENGWIGDTWIDPDDLAFGGSVRKAAE
jgi:hypothetical protein